MSSEAFLADPGSVRSLGLAVLVAGCGRVGFYATPAPDDAAVAPSEAEIPIDARLTTDAPMLMLDAGQCPNGYTRAGQSCYRLSLVRAATWLDAELLCEADAVGAHLLTVDNAEEAALIDAAIDQTTDWWSGMSDRIDEGTYRNVTGEAAPYLVWATSEPSSSDCAQFDGVEFHVSTCDTDDEYLCEFDGRPAQAGAY